VESSISQVSSLPRVRECSKSLAPKTSCTSMWNRLVLLALSAVSVQAWTPQASLSTSTCAPSPRLSLNYRLLRHQLGAVPPQLRDDEDLLSDGSAREKVSFTALVKNKQAESAASDKKDGHHLSIGQLLSDYGLIALAFHFTVWISSLATVYTALSMGIQLPEMPEFLAVLMKSSGETTESAAATAAIGAAAGVGVGGKAAAMARLAATVGLVEVVGPLRLALTVAVTPPLSGYVRQFSVVRDTEGKILNFLSTVKAKVLPGGATPPSSQ